MAQKKGIDFSDNAINKSHLLQLGFVESANGSHPFIQGSINSNLKLVADLKFKT